MSDITENPIQDSAKPQEVCQRVIPLARVMFGLLVMAFVINALLNTVDHMWPGWLPHKMSGTGFQKDITQRVESAQQAFADNPSLKNEKLCVFLGLSSQRESVDLQTLTQIDDIDAKYLGLCGAGASMSTMQQQSSALLASDLKPNLVVIGINLYHQVDPLVIEKLKQNQGPAVVDNSIPILTPLLKGDLRTTYHQTRQRIWVYERRRDVNTVITEKLAAINGGILKLFHTTSSKGMDELTSPWREMIRLQGPEHASAATFAGQIKSYGNRGLFDEASYEPEHIAEEQKALNQIITQLQSRGATVLIMLMPEHSTLRASVPEVAMTRLKDNLQATFGENAPQIIDMQAALDDEKFSDISHVNTSGRMAYTKLISPMLVQRMQ